MTGAVATRINLRGEADYKDIASKLLEKPGDAAFVRRGKLRSVVIKCPDGCGETLVINVDDRAEKAWRLIRRGKNLTLFPSVWRDGGCGSHFIVWKSNIIWCGKDEDDFRPTYDPGLEQRVLAALQASKYRKFGDVANELDEDPWEVLQACKSLVWKGFATQGPGRDLDLFRVR